jgi:hypothetical protein
MKNFTLRCHQQNALFSATVTYNTETSTFGRVNEAGEMCLRDQLASVWLLEPDKIIDVKNSEKKPQCDKAYQLTDFRVEEYEISKWQA